MIDQVKKAVPSVTVAHNLQPPRKGSFVVTVKGKEIVNLLDMPRPFTKLRATPLEEVAAQAVAELRK